MSRLTVAGLMVVVALVAAGLAAVRLASPLMLDLVSGVTLLVLALGLLGVVVRATPQPGWRGFALFGWGYILIVTIPMYEQGAPRLLPTDGAVHAVVERLRPSPVPPTRPPFSSAYAAVNFRNNLDQEVLSWPTSSGSFIPLTPAEVKAWNEYKSALDLHEASAAIAADRFGIACRLCHFEIALALAIFGAVAGQLLVRRRPGTSSTGPAASQADL